MDEVYIAVMGPTGSGKSTFIRQVTGDQRCKIGKTLESETLEVQGYRCQHQGRNYVLIDTPGFDDSYKSNDEIVDTILAWLEKSYRARNLLSGIVYLHRISDVRMQGTSLDNLRMFRKLCGFEALKNVLLVTTFWDTISDAEGRRREQELSRNDDFWGRMIMKGSRMRRWSYRTPDEARSILDAVVPEAKRALQAQVEIVDLGKHRKDTDVLRTTLEAMQVEMNARLEQEKQWMRDRLEQEQFDVRMQHEFAREYLRQNAAQQRQIEEDAMLAAQWDEFERFEMENTAAKLQMQRQIQLKQEEARQVEIRFKEEEARAQAATHVYPSFQCHHDAAETWRGCDKCGEKLHKDRSHYFHCCYCSGPNYQYNYNQCSTCGNNCLVFGHPEMTKKVAMEHHSCIIM
ncbi:P-loop containing nucleoside triphosphate hydrolase protein [Paraphoma chrysanthemicola]|nr:P-loop containing nucleoside triphosphate hydrolase protein [Paraphoma chrysanthemicola]